MVTVTTNSKFSNRKRGFVEDESFGISNRVGFAAG